METTDLTSPSYWESERVDIRLNPRREIDASGLRSFLESDCGVRSSVVMATSGSTGSFKFVVLPKLALLHSARAVVAHCGIVEEDVWLAGLSGFHVGGLGIYARGYVGGSRVAELLPGAWKRDGKLLVKSTERSGATLTSMTPTHLYDLVSHSVKAPSSLRGVLLGGGLIEPSMVAQARELGWPVWASYGMTEACSQVATGLDGDVDHLAMLPIWEHRMAMGGRLAIRGEALFSGYATKEQGVWRFETGTDSEGWFVTGDRCEIEEKRLRFVGRSDDLVKVTGELVSLSALNSLALGVAHDMGIDAAVVAVPDERRENELVLVVEATESDGANLVQRLNRELDGIERISRVVILDELPRTEIGKLDQPALRELAAEIPEA